MKSTVAFLEAVHQGVGMDSPEKGSPLDEILGTVAISEIGRECLKIYLKLQASGLVKNENVMKCPVRGSQADTAPRDLVSYVVDLAGTHRNNPNSVLNDDLFENLIHLIEAHQAWERTRKNSEEDGWSDDMSARFRQAGISAFNFDLFQAATNENVAALQV